ncbi:MAG: hypothetical protein OEU26_13430 [Candidatus Tectomicrobia bacterium]|nr:hypothetical protein [Candidatus Tectomicrobia bacterium]
MLAAFSSLCSSPLAESLNNETARHSRGNCPKQTAARAAKATAFTLKDQFKKEHRYHFPRPRASVLIFADRAGAEQLKDWVRPIYARYQDRVSLDGVADLSKVPRFARSMVRAFFRGQLDYPVMLDWSGEVTANYDYQPGEANLFVIDADGRIVFKVIGGVNPTKLQRVFAALGELLVCKS